MMKIQYFSIAFILCFSSCNTVNSQNSDEKVANKKNQELIIEKYLKNGAWKHELYSREWQEEIDKGLAEDSTIAYLWQQKAMPLFKQRKYEVGMIFIDKAVKYDPERWQDYRAFIKCIFAKQYRKAIADFMDYKSKFGDGFVMDHSYDFYIGISYLQLNEFELAENFLRLSIQSQTDNQGLDWVHHLDLFYLGISLLEQKKYEEAISEFEKAISKYPEFSEAIYFKGYCYKKIGKKEEADKLTRQAIEYGLEGYSINEDNTLYEQYPYQIRWREWYNN